MSQPVSDAVPVLPIPGEESRPASRRPDSAVATRSGRVVFLIGGTLFVLAGVCGLATLGPLAGFAYEALGDGAVVLQTIGRVLFSAAMIVFAIGGARGGSVVARKPLGMAALVVAAVWPLVTAIPNVATLIGFGGDVGYVVRMAIEIAVGLVAVIEIVRSGAVPGWPRWIPLVLFVAYEALLVAPQIMMRVLAPMAWDAPAYVVIYIPFILLWLAAPFVLGGAAIILAVVAGRREATRADEQPLPAAAEPTGASD